MLDDLRPSHVAYQNLKTALSRYRAIQSAGGWEPVPTGATLKRGTADDRVPVLRKRLSISGDWNGEPSGETFFDQQLEQAVKAFQRRHRLTADGVVGKKTLEALNVSVEARIDQIRVNLERARWVLHAVSGKIVLVDIAGFHVFFYEEDRITWESRVQVGRPYRRTPVFRSDIKYLVFNPTCTVPPGILRRDILPAVKKNPNYLRERNMNVIDRQGKIINQDTIDWSQYPQKNFP
jgi:murein L,D-transpeptidase YcbB/YkuD